MITLSELVRSPAGTMETYTMYRGETPYFLKKLSTYAKRANAKIFHKVGTTTWDDEDTVSRMVVCKVIKPGKKLKRQKRK